MILNVDTTHIISSIISIHQGIQTIISEKFFDTPNRSLLADVHTIVSKHSQIWLHELSQITVNAGPGTRFTRTRLGVTVANALGFALNIPVNGDQFAIPTYNKPPNITKSKK